jgi:hypothetical protein
MMIAVGKSGHMIVAPKIDIVEKARQDIIKIRQAQIDLYNKYH